jgi:hypothetical protein
LCVVAWFVVYGVIKGGTSFASVPQLSYWRLTEPGLPGYVLLAAAVPLLVPGLGTTVPRVAPSSSGGFRLSRGLIAAAVLLTLVPLLMVAAAKPMAVPSVMRNVDNTEAPISNVFGLTSQAVPGGVRLSWQAPPAGHTNGWYVVYRSNSAQDCTPLTPGAHECEIGTTAVATTRALTIVDLPGTGHWWYRVGLVANQDSSAPGGDMMLISPSLETIVG